MTLSSHTPLTCSSNESSPVVINGVVIGSRPATPEEVKRNVERWHREQREKDQRRKNKKEADALKRAGSATLAQIIKSHLK